MKDWIISVLLIVSMLVCVSAGIDPLDTWYSHEHDWTEVSRVPSTCSTAGSVTYHCSGEGKCEFGRTKTESLPLLPHTVVVDDGVSPTCETEGITVGSHCAVCNAVIVKQQQLDALGHDFTEKVTTEEYYANYADCTHPTTYYYSCHCGKCGTETFGVGDPLGHDFDEQLKRGEYGNLISSIVKAPTNTDDGIALIYCSKCNSYAQAPIPKLSTQDFVVVPYIESTGNEYLDSGFVVNHDDTVIFNMDMQFIEKRTNDWAGANGYLQFEYGYVNHCNRTNLTIEYNKYGHHEENIFDNGTLVKMRDWTNLMYSDVKIGFFSLGNIDNTWWNTTYCQRARLYGANIIKNGYVVGCYVPVINAKTGETGLYNVIAKQFVGNTANTGNFVLPDGYKSVIEKVPSNTEEGLIAVYYPNQQCPVTIPVPAIDREKYVVVPCIESTGREYIDTGLQLSYNDNAIYSLDFQLLSSAVSCWAGANWLLDFDYSEVKHFNRTNLQIQYNLDGDHSEVLYDDDRIALVNDPTGHELEHVKIGIFRLGNQNNTWWGTEQTVQYARFYGGHIEIDGKQAGIYLPVFNAQTGDAGIYDVVSGRFLCNASSQGAFALLHDYEVTTIQYTPKVIKRYTCRYCGHTYDGIALQSASLPDEYQRLDSISIAEAGAYIDTGFFPNQNTSIEVEFSSTNYANNMFYLFGSGASSAYIDSTFEFFPWDNAFHVNFGNSYTNFGTPSPYVKYHVKMEKGKCYVTNDETLLLQGSCPVTTFTSPNTLTLFALHRNTGPLVSPTGTIHSCIIKENDVPVRTFIPAKRMSDGAIGMYDLVNDKFYCNAGWGSFSAGANIDPSKPQTLPDEYAPLEYIQTTGTQYIDTGFTTTNGMIAQYTASFSTIDNSFGYVVGSHSTTPPYGRNGGFLDLARGCWELGYGELFLQNTTYERIENKVYSVEFSTLCGNAYLKVNGSTLLETTELQSTSPTPVYLFTNDYTNAVGLSPTLCKLYACRLYDSSNTLVRDFVPAKRLANGEIGLYDTVTKQFFQNDGKGCFFSNEKSHWQIPEQYVPLDYIQTTGAQYIDTGVNDAIDITIDCDMEVLVARNNYLFGSTQDADHMMYNGLYNYNQFEYNWLTASLYSSTRRVMAQRWNGDGTITVNINTETLTLPVGTVEPSGHIYIFACNNGSRCYGDGLVCRYFKMYSHGNLIRNFIPAKRISDNAIGLYDTVTEKFFENLGSGAFTCEEYYDDIDDYTILDKITFDGEHHILLQEKFNGYFEVNATSLDGKKVYPIYNNGYCLGNVAHPYLSKVFDLYELTSYYQDTVLHHYLPVKHNTSDTVGVYDTVIGRFYPLVSSYSDSLTPYFFTDSSKYNPDIAILSATASTDNYLFANLLLQQGYSIIAEYKEVEVVTDSIHKVPYTLYEKTYAQDGTFYRLYFLYVSGTTGDGEWKSNFTLGYNTNGFHEGFEQGANFILNDINNYIQDDPLHNKMIVFGFSRGSAVASIVSAKYIDQGTKFAKENIYTYALACPNYSMRSSQYDNIFQICSLADMVTHIPPVEWGYSKEGVVIWLPCDSGTISLLNDKMLQYQHARGWEEIGYTGFTEDISPQVGKLCNYLSVDVVRNPDNLDKITNLFNTFYGNAPLNLSDTVSLLMQLKLGGNIFEMYSTLQFFVSTASKNVPSHDNVSYLCWIEILNERLAQ